MVSFRWVLLVVVSFFMSSPGRSYATLGEGLSSLSRDGEALSAGLEKPKPCVTPKENLTDPPGFYENQCMFYRITSMIGTVDVREYVLINPPMKIFGVYWEGSIPTKIVLGAKNDRKFRKAIRRPGHRIETGSLLIFRRKNRYFVVDTTLVPKGVKIGEISPIQPPKKRNPSQGRRTP